MQRTVLTVTSLFLIAAPAASASEPGPADDRSSWSLGGGVGFSTLLGLGGLGAGAGALGSTFTVMPSVGALTEYRASDVVALAFGVTGSVRRAERDGEDTTLDSFVDVQLATRFVVTPGARVEVSPFIALLGGWSEYDEVPAWSVGLEAGIAAEMELVDALWLRLGVGLASLRYVTSDEASVLLGALTFSPTLTLRMEL